MKLLIAGSRTIPDEGVNWINPKWGKITEVVSGTARGGDKVGEAWAAIHDLSVIQFPADWDRYGKSAGHRRNEVMGAYCDAAVILLDGALMDKSAGTWGMMKILEKENKPYQVILWWEGMFITDKKLFHNPGSIHKPLTQRIIRAKEA